MANYTLNYTGEKVDELLNKIDTAFGETTVMSDTLTWDGNTEGLYSVMGMAYKVSDAVPTLEELQQGGSITMSVSGTDITASFANENVIDASTMGMGTNTIMVTADDCSVYIATEDGATMQTGETEFSTFEKAGVYFLYIEGVMKGKSFTINNYTGFERTEIKTIDPKYIPKSEVVFTIDSLPTAKATPTAINSTKTAAEFLAMSSEQLMNSDFNCKTETHETYAKPCSVGTYTATDGVITRYIGFTINTGMSTVANYSIMARSDSEEVMMMLL